MNFYVVFQLKVSSAEFSAASTGMYFARLVDNTTGHSVSLKYDYTNHRFQWYFDYTSTGFSQTINMPFTMVDAWVGFRLDVLDMGAGLKKVGVWFQNTFYGSMAVGTINYDRLWLGGIDNVGFEPVDHSYRVINAGTTPGGTDIFFGTLASETITPPFDFAVGQFFSVTNVGTVMRVQNAGDQEAYVIAILFSP